MPALRLRILALALLLEPAAADSDWIEITNQLAVDLDLSGWSLADGVGYPFPQGTILPAGPTTYDFRTNFDFAGVPATNRLRLRLLMDDGAAVFLNGIELVRSNLAVDAGPATTSLHDDFALSAAGEVIVLTAPDGTRIDAVAFGPQTRNVSEGAYPDGGNHRAVLSAPTPGAPNVLLRAVGLTQGEGVAEFTFTSTPGRRYRIEASDDLSGWMVVAPEVAATGPLTWWSEPLAGTRRFVRAVLLPD
ncbi:MAG: lamin tail domain-containing protein [Akkermansiaceae bacterium]|jgi:hypothetical protein|nr:lamin tail domain-containing protein [Akkermansiaceae bacterium]